MTVDSIMTRHVYTVRMDDTLAVVRQVLEKHRFHHVVVIENGRAMGVISDRDLFMNLSPFLGKLSERTQDAECLKKPAHQVMSRKLTCIRPDTSVADAISLVLTRSASCLIVQDERQRCVGIVTTRDLLRWCTACAAAASASTPAA